ncbi:hypothetical protein [Fontibacter flavus]|uniref:Uncharacterized protein n=1 Tax=Fontibacter flavus TaxID=654838 RepID=A0ABV6FRL1_9BACT
MFGNFYHLAIAIGFLVSLILLKDKKGKELIAHKVIAFTLFLVLIMELAGSYTASKSINNSLLYNIGWVYIESFLLIYYFNLLEFNEKFKRSIFYISLGLLALGLINSLFFQSLTQVFQFYSFLPFALLIIVLAVRFLTNLMNLRVYADYNLVLLPHFWICWAILLFYIEAILLFGAYQFRPVLVLDNVHLLFTINKLVAGLMYLVFGLAFMLPWIYKKKLVIE